MPRWVAPNRPDWFKNWVTLIILGGMIAGFLWQLPWPIKALIFIGAPVVAFLDAKRLKRKTELMKALQPDSTSRMLAYGLNEYDPCVILCPKHGKQKFKTFVEACNHKNFCHWCLSSCYLQAEEAGEAERKRLEEKVEAKKSYWIYSTDEGGMRGTAAILARLPADEQWGRDYDLALIDLNLRKSPEFGNDIYFTISGNGKWFDCPRYSGCVVSYKFDDDPVRKSQMVPGKGDSLHIMFLNENVKKFTTRMKTAEKLTIEFDFISYGSKQFTFPVQNLKWEHW